MLLHIWQTEEIIVLTKINTSLLMMAIQKMTLKVSLFAHKKDYNAWKIPRFDP